MGIDRGLDPKYNTQWPVVQRMGSQTSRKLCSGERMEAIEIAELGQDCGLLILATGILLLVQHSETPCALRQHNAKGERDKTTAHASTNTGD